MDFYFSRFVEGVNDALLKVGYENVFDVTGTIFPNISSQTKWHFEKTPTHIYLNDGTNTHTFHTPEGSNETEDFPLIKLNENTEHVFGSTENKHLAQVHKADPGAIYFTVQDGKANPTYTFKHISAEQWRAMPKVKKAESAVYVDEQAFINGVQSKIAEEGLTASIIDNVLKGGDRLGRKAINGAMSTGHNPLLSAGIGLAGGAAYDLSKRRFYNSEEENNEETNMDRLKRYLVPAVAAGGSGAVLRSAFPNYYSAYPVYKF